MTHAHKVTEPAPCMVTFVDRPIPEGHQIINGKLYRTTHDWRELQHIILPDGSRPTACALVPVDEDVT